MTALSALLLGCAPAGSHRSQSCTADWRSHLGDETVSFSDYACAVIGAFQECDPRIVISRGVDELTVSLPNGGRTVIHTCCYSDPPEPAERVELVWNLMTDTVGANYASCTNPDIEVPQFIENVEDF